MYIENLLPPISGLQLLGANFQERQITLLLKSSSSFACCPLCQNISSRIHSHYSRTVSDLPWADKQVVLSLEVRRFFCDHDDCSRKIFTERLGDTAAPHPAIAAYARRTARLDHYLQNIALLLGGEGAALLAYLLNISTVSADTLLNLTRKIQITTFDTPKILGIDEWSLRKGKTYATILVDLEKRRPIDLLPDAKADTVETWLKEHPGIEIISRDRDTAFAGGARRGAPEAIQVADRWHLLKNLGEALKKMLEINPTGLRDTARALLGLPTISSDEGVDYVQEEHAETLLKDTTYALTTKSSLRHQQVRELRAKGWSIKAIARHFKMHRQTVKKYISLDVLPKKSYSHHMNAKGALTQEQKSWISKRWSEDGLNANQIFKELKEQGYKGSASCIYRFVAHFPGKSKISQSPQRTIKRGIAPFSAPKAMWLMVKSEEQLSEKKQKQLKMLLENHTQASKAYPLVQQFIAMVKNRKSENLDEWLKEAKECDIIQMQRFAQGLERDYQAVKAALSLEWSNGQVEGQITRLKFIKRQGYGRAKLDLLKKKVMYRPDRGAA